MKITIYGAKNEKESSLGGREKGWELIKEQDFNHYEPTSKITFFIDKDQFKNYTLLAIEHTN